MIHIYKVILFICASFALVAIALFASDALAQGPKLNGNRALTSAFGTSFTYQGQLKNGGVAVNNTCDFQFGLWDANISGNLVGVTTTVTSIPVTNGLFTAPIDFGNTAFTGGDRWLAIAIACPSNSRNYVLLDSRQQLTPDPYSIYSASTGALNGYTISSTAPITGQVLKWNGSAWVPSTLATPLAYGSVSFTGTVLAGSPNISVTYAPVYTSTMPPTQGITVTDVYLINITGETYDYRKDVTVVTPEVGCYYHPWTFNLDNMLIIQFHNDYGGQYTYCNFDFITFKP